MMMDASSFVKLFKSRKSRIVLIFKNLSKERKRRKTPPL